MNKGIVDVSESEVGWILVGFDVEWSIEVKRRDGLFGVEWKERKGKFAVRVRLKVATVIRG